MAHNRAQPLPDNVTDLADLTMCSFCGETYLFTRRRGDAEERKSQ
jgi:hypothetical protein